MESYRRALRRWASERRPTPAETVVAVRLGPPATARARDGSDGLAFCLVFDQADFVGCRPYDPAAEVRLCAAASTVEAVVSGRTTGSAASMSGLVALDGDRAALQRVAAAAGGPRFRSYIADISGTSGAGSVGGAGPDVVAVLGAPNDPTGMLSRMAIDRCATAVGLCGGSPAAGLVLSGGFGAHFNTSGEPHWRHCERWIARRFGAGRARVVGCVESRHTYEDVLLLRELIGLLQPRSVTVVTSDYHVARARFLLDVVLPAAAIRGVRHDGLSAAEYERFRQHEHEALARTVAATLLFGVDRLPAEPAPEHNDGRLIVRLPPR